MFSRLFSIVAISSMLSACSGTFDVSPARPTPEHITTVTVEQPAPEKKDFTEAHGTNWTMNVPNDWVVVDDVPSIANGKIELMVRTKKMLGEGPVLIGIAVTPWKHDQGTSEDFVKNIAGIDAARQDIAVLQYDDGEFQGNPATLATIIIGNQTMVETQLVTARNEFGYVVKCAGDVKKHTAVIKKCGDVLNTFQIRK